MAKSTLPPAPHDGSTGNLIRRAEPKVKAASIAALLTPLALYYLYRYVPGVASLPHELAVVLATLVTGLTTFAAGYMARAVDRVDLLFGAPLAKAEQAVTRAGDDTIGAKATDELEQWTEGLAHDVAVPVKTAVVDAVHAVEAAAEAGHDPVAAAQDQVPDVVDAVHEAAAEVQADVAPAVEQAVVDAPVVAAQVAAAPAKSASELEDLLRQMIAVLGQDGTPIGDAAQAAAATPVSAPAAVADDQARAVPAPAAPVDPPTTPMAAVAASAAPAAG